MSVPIVSDRKGLAEALKGLPRPLAFVPTMGALHHGHLSLVRAAREQAASVVVSIFVNPLQFERADDLAAYHRDLDADARLLEGGADLVFAPSERVVYPHAPHVTVSAGELGRRLEGASRSGHFDGVLTVLAILFNLVGADIAVFGEKDAQQVALIRAMVADLAFPVRIVDVPTARDPDGLAASSRNSRLSSAGRALALALPRALDAAVAEPTAGRALAAAHEVLADQHDLALDYVTAVDPITFLPVPAGHRRPFRLLAAVVVEGVRLIDTRLAPADM